MRISSLGLVRGLIYGVFGAGFGMALTLLVRALLGRPEPVAEPVTAIGAICWVVAFLAGVGRELERLREAGGEAALLLANVVGFRDINDSQGHRVGDAVLQEVARRLRQVVRVDDVVGRMDGDEFTVFLAPVRDPGELEALAQATGLLAFRAGEGEGGESVYYLVGIDKARFKRPVGPGDQLRLEVELKRLLKGMGIFACVARVDGEVCAEAQIMCTTKDPGA